MRQQWSFAFLITAIACIAGGSGCVLEPTADSGSPPDETDAGPQADGGERVGRDGGVAVDEDAGALADGGELRGDSGTLVPDAGGSFSDGGGLLADGGGTGTDGGTSVEEDGGPAGVGDAGEPVVDAGPDIPPNLVIPDVNGDGTVNILVLGTSRSIHNGGEAFAADGIAAELQSILDGDSSIALEANVVAEDIYGTAAVTIGLGQGGTEYTWTHSRHSLLQYLFWPAGQAERRAQLRGNAGTDWDHVIVAADPHVVAKLPGFYALGVNLIAEQVSAGGGVTHLLATWPKTLDGIEHFVDVARRTAAKARVPLSIVPAAQAWAALEDAQRDSSNEHPTPLGAYTVAATFYAQLFQRSAATSTYGVDAAVADTAFNTAMAPEPSLDDLGPITFVTPFSGVGLPDRVMTYNHTGTSSENGIRGGLQWVLAKANVQLQNGGDSPLNFNYGRANTNFEADKRYQIDPVRFDASVGFPMQDHGGLGDESMLYGIDRRLSESENGTDLGVALFMEREEELPHARAVPIRTLYALLKDAIPTFSAYRDAWHMHRDLDKASASFMYTMLTGHCAVDEEPADVTSAAWSQWLALKIGYETAWTTMHLSGVAPGFRVLPESVESRSVSPTEDATLSVSFVNPPSQNVTVRFSSDNDAALSYSPSELVFTPDNYAVAQVVTLSGAAGLTAAETAVFTSSTASEDVAFDGIADRWTYAIDAE